MSEAPTRSRALAGAERCDNHPERPAVALCVDCGKRICRACATRWEGIHLCASCLAARRGTRRQRGAVLGWIAMGLALAGALAAATYLRAGVAALLAGLS